MPKKSIKHYITALQSFQDGTARLGESMIYFQRIEEVLSVCISAMVGRDRVIGDILTSEMSFRCKVEVFRALFLHKTSLEKLPDDVKKLLGRVYAAEQKRNNMAHSAWDANLKVPTTIQRKKNSCRNSGLVKVAENVLIEDLEIQIKEFENVCEDLMYIMGEYLPKVTLRFDK